LPARCFASALPGSGRWLFPRISGLYAAQTGGRL
jgi:hypothetical protein